MLQTFILSIVVVPLILGIVAAIGAQAAGGAKSATLALLLPVFAAVILIGLEGWPAFPPVRAAHKLPYVFLLGGLGFGIAAIALRRAGGAIAVIGAAVALALPIWWLGGTILSNNATKATTVAILFAVAIFGVIWRVFSSKGAADANVLPQALFATSVAGALVAIFGGYMGMAMFNGGLAALAGGFVLVTYIRFLRGDENAFALPGGAALAFAWVAFIGLVVTAISAPKASAAALAVTALTLAIAPLAALYTPRLASLPRTVRPLVAGLIAAIPALAGILIAGLQFAG